VLTIGWPFMSRKQVRAAEKAGWFSAYLPKLRKKATGDTLHGEIPVQQGPVASSPPESEAFLNLLRAAREKEQLGRPDEVIVAYMEATAACPTRAEALLGAARLCRNKGIYERGYEFASQGLAIAYPTNAPAVEDWIYEYGLLDEFAVNAYWTGKYAECVDACDRLLNEGKLPIDERDRVLKNRQFGIDKLAEVKMPRAITLESGPT
jgi:hypothetical protein